MEVACAKIVIEGHVKWFYELSPFIQKSAKSQNESLQSYCARLLRVNESENGYGSAEEEDDDDDNQPVGESWKDKATLLAKKLNRVAMCILAGDKVNGGLLLEQLDSRFDKIGDTADTQCQLIMYCKDVLKSQIMEEDDGERLKNQMWEELTVGKVKAEATVYFLQGMLGVDMKIDGDKITDLYLQAADLDPSCLVWCHHVYRSIRRNRGKGANQGGPSRKERSLVERAYHLCEGQNAVIALDYGLLLKEKLWGRKRDEGLWTENIDNHEIYIKCVQVLESAEKISKGSRRMKSKLYLAEFLYFGKTPESDRKRGREMLLELEREFPNSFCVLHKLGNVFRAEEDFNKARECYQRALQKKPFVVPCIMDYVKCLKRQGDRPEIKKVLTTALSPDYVRSDKDQEILQMELIRMQQPKKKTWHGNVSEADMDSNWRQ